MHLWAQFRRKFTQVAHSVALAPLGSRLLHAAAQFFLSQILRSAVEQKGWQDSVAHSGALISGFTHNIRMRLGVERELETSWPIGSQSLFALMVIPDMVFASLCEKCVLGIPEDSLTQPLFRTHVRFSETSIPVSRFCKNKCSAHELGKHVFWKP